MNRRFEFGIAFISNPFVAAIVGAAVGFFICWSTVARPLVGHLDQREKSLHEWERINRQEREAIANIHTISTEELRKWVSTLDEQNTRYAQLQTLLHKQELSLLGPATTHLWIALSAVLGVVGFAAWMIRDSNADAARTLQNAVAVLPSLREALRERRAALEAATPEVTRLEASYAATICASPSDRRTGRIKRFMRNESYGFIAADDGGENIFFHKRNVKLAESQLISEGNVVSFRLSKDARGRARAEDIEIDG